MAKNPTLSRLHQSAWYARTRNAPVRWRACLEKRHTYKRARRDGPPVGSQPRPVSKPPPEDPEQRQAEGVTWTAFCEAHIAGLESQASST